MLRITSPSGLHSILIAITETSVCQNDCGGHGVCDEATRECRCQPFWIENVVSRRLFGGRPNCSWSLVYVVVAAVTGLAALIVFYCCYCRSGFEITQFFSC